MTARLAHHGGWLLKGLCLLGGAALALGALADQRAYPFSLVTEKEATGHRIMARNRGPAPVSVRVEISQGPEMAVDRAFPLYAVVPPDSSVALAHIRPAVHGVGYQFSTRAQWQLGDFNAAHGRDAGYRLPWPEGLAFMVSQAADGPRRTHTTPDSFNAVDIPMPEGTPVLAARDGVVVDTDADETESGQTPDMLGKANAVRILHADGTVATYAHLAPGGVLVQPGERVAAGTRIGLAGSTGYSSGPHLHFAVQKVVRQADGLANVSIPFRFRLGSPPVVFEPRFGMLLTADDSRPGLLPLVAEGAMAASVELRNQQSLSVPARAAPLVNPVPAWRQVLLDLEWWQWLGGLAALWGLGTLLLPGSGRRR